MPIFNQCLCKKTLFNREVKNGIECSHAIVCEDETIFSREGRNGDVIDPIPDLLRGDFNVIIRFKSRVAPTP